MGSPPGDRPSWKAPSDARMRHLYNPIPDRPAPTTAHHQAGKQARSLPDEHEQSIVGTGPQRDESFVQNLVRRTSCHNNRAYRQLSDHDTQRHQMVPRPLRSMRTGNSLNLHGKAMWTWGAAE